MQTFKLDFALASNVKDFNGHSPDIRLMIFSNAMFLCLEPCDHKKSDIAQIKLE